MAAADTANIGIPDMTDGALKAAVLLELDRLKSHDLLKDTTRMKRFLDYIVTETLEGRSHLLKGYTVGLEVFDRPDDFDPQADTIVRVQAGQLRRRLDLIYGSDEKPTDVRILVPKGRYAPVFEMRSDIAGIEGSAETPMLPAPTPTPNTSENYRPGLIVTTLENLTAEAESNYFAEGLTLELINALVQFRYLRIISLGPTVTAHPDLSDIKKIGETYDAQFILSGSVRQADDVFRVSTNLLSTETGEHVFSEIFDRQYIASNLFEVQEEIASHTAAAIAAPFGVINRYNRRPAVRERRTIPAYEALLKFYSISLNPTTDKAAELLKEFEALNKTVPTFSSGWAVTALLYCFLCAYCVPSRCGGERLKLAIAAGTKATGIDPRNALGYVALFHAYYHSGEFELAEKMAARALQLNPNDDAMLAFYGISKAMRGDCATAIAYQEAAQAINPRPPAWYYLTTVLCAFIMGEDERVVGVIGDISEETPAAATMLKLASLGYLGQQSDADEILKPILAANPNYGVDVLQTLKLWHPSMELRERVIKGWKAIGLIDQAP
ncbi:hypothetical protein ACJ3XI_03765 [Litorimonas sp. RW-G-Af-16]|uniref:hypothetical protein n=1 Tax=Litorimonas sp. RW-G-Af-16 TaxID=3241168 RepID=UPI00390CD396